MIWIIDDDSIHNLAVEIMIKNSTWKGRVTSFQKASEALTILKESSQLEDFIFPKVIFLDLNMTEMSGWEFLEAFDLIEHPKKKLCSIFVVTSSVSALDEENSLSNPYVSRFLSKPLTIDFFNSLNNEYEKILGER